jgi:hypothetical protein
MKQMFRLSTGYLFEYEPKRIPAETVLAIANEVAAIAQYTRQGGGKTPKTLAAIAEKHGTTERTVKRIRRRLVENCAIKRAA